jgi:hypothetical protein
VVPSRGEVALVGRDAQPVHLRVRVGDGAGAYSTQCLPEAWSCMLAGGRGEGRLTERYRIV